MKNYILKKILNAFFTLFGVISVVFILFNILPGDPARMMLGQSDDIEQIQIINKKYGFDKPIFTQYIYYLNDISPISIHSKEKEHYTSLLTDNYTYKTLLSIKNKVLVVKYPYLRRSFAKQGKRVSEILKETFPNTIVLAVSSIIIALIFGLSLGVISALFKDKPVDRIISVISTLGMSLPSFFSAIIFAWIFGFLLHEYTGLNMTGNLYELDDFGEGMQLNLKNLILPSLVLGIRPLAVISQLMRNSLIEVYAEEYIKTARAKGLSPKKVLINHALKNSLSPVITAISGWFASMLAGAVFVEYVFGWNGLGKEIVNALNNLDLPVIMGAVLLIASIFVTINIVVDIIYTYLNPKVKLS